MFPQNITLMEGLSFHWWIKTFAIPLIIPIFHPIASNVWWHTTLSFHVLGNWEPVIICLYIVISFDNFIAITIDINISIKLHKVNLFMLLFLLYACFYCKCFWNDFMQIFNWSFPMSWFCSFLDLVEFILEALHLSPIT